jgi:hypothetical protein
MDGDVARRHDVVGAIQHGKVLSAASRLPSMLATGSSWICLYP